jgi:hypothetical protein
MALTLCFNKTHSTKRRFHALTKKKRMTRPRWLWYGELSPHNNLEGPYGA